MDLNTINALSDEAVAEQELGIGIGMTPKAAELLAGIRMRSAVADAEVHWEEERRRACGMVPATAD